MLTPRSSGEREVVLQDRKQQHLQRMFLKGGGIALCMKLKIRRKKHTQGATCDRRADVCGVLQYQNCSFTLLRYEVWRRRMGAQWFGHCEMCGDRLCCLEPSGWHCAHNVAWTRGGSHDVENRRVSCPKCNMSTSTLNFDEQAELRRPSPSQPATLATYITAAATSWWKKIFW